MRYGRRHSLRIKQVALPIIGIIYNTRGKMYLYHERYDFSQRLPTAYVDFNTFPVEDIIVIYNGRYIDRRRYSRRNEDNTFSTHFSALANFFIDGATIKFCSLQKKQTK